MSGSGRSVAIEVALRAPGEAFVKSREPMARMFDAIQHTYT